MWAVQIRADKVSENIDKNKQRNLTQLCVRNDMTAYFSLEPVGPNLIVTHLRL